MNTPSSIRYAAISLAIAASLVGCSSVRPPSAISHASAAIGAPERLYNERTQEGSEQPRPVAPDDWWRSFRDKQLDTLVDEAEMANRSLSANLAAVQEARALAGERRWDASPRGGVALGASRQRLAGPEVDPFGGDVRGPTRELAQMDLSATWELDLFGRIGTRRAIAERGIDLANADLHASRALVHAETVAAWARWRGSTIQLRLLDEEIATAEHAVSLQQQRINAGIDDPRLIQRPAVWLAERRVERANVRASQAVARSALAVLRGRVPSADHLPEPVDPDLPAAPLLTAWASIDGILQRRPDVARADALFRQSIGAKAIADRAFLPEIRVDFGGGVVQRPGDLDLASAGRWATAGVVQWNPIDWGRLRAQASASSARSDLAYAALESTMLEAIKDAEDRIEEARAADASVEQALTTAGRARRVQEATRARHEAGLEGRLALAEAKLMAWELDRVLIDAKAASIQAYARAHLALATWQDQREETTLGR
jgi:outer membrane protein TolC